MVDTSHETAVQKSERHAKMFALLRGGPSTPTEKLRVKYLDEDVGLRMIQRGLSSFRNPPTGDSAGRSASHPASPLQNRPLAG